ncbi:RraA family protein [uncultured Roseibium sp.]|uniref:RraA family protein n=1 Tax=uncultured Roseibium sp. TaxID=1936171 RepID=UPI00261A9D19|nr:RraA family protein [uncultured Roseibium sp.]
MIEEPPVLTIKRHINRPTPEQIEAFRDVPTGFVCDAMNGQGALDCVIQPIGNGRDIDCRAVGPALVAENGPAEILATMGALHVLEPGDIVVSAVHGHRNCSASGDQFCGMLKNKGAAGFVTDGAMRDYEGIVEVGMPVWCAGLSPNSPYSNGPARVGFGAVVGGRQIESGDLIVADRNGVVVVPFSEIDAVAEKVRQVRALEEELEAKVANGFHDMQLIAEMIADGRAVVID